MADKADKPTPRARLTDDKVKKDDKAKKSEEQPQQPEVTLPSKAAFIRTVLETNPDATTKVVVEEWAKAGYPAEKAPTASDVTQTKTNVRRKERGLPRARLTASGEALADEKSELEWYKGIENTLENLILEAMRTNRPDMIEWLRQARRRATVKVMQLMGELP